MKYFSFGTAGSRLVLLLTVLVVACSAFPSCNKDNESEDLPQPIQDIIAQSRDCTCIPYFDRYTWRGQTVYVQDCKGPTCNCRPLYYDAAGARFDLPQGYTAGQFFQEATFQKNVWTCGG